MDGLCNGEIGDRDLCVIFGDIDDGIAILCVFLENEY
jgi:hypothetical protein